jgi:ATP-binding cassette subfamily B protein
MGGGSTGRGLRRSFAGEEDGRTRRLRPGAGRRILAFARPYRRQLAIFLGLIVVGAVLGAAVPLVFRAIIDEGILGRNPPLVVQLAVLIGVLALAETALSLWQRWVSARIGESLIFDMRTQVFEHFQRMPIAFFTRTQTGALVSRLDNDVLGAQRAFTETLSSVVGNLVGVVVTLAAMAILSWELTLVSLALLPLIILPSRWAGRRLAAITRESYTLNAAMTATMVERFNVAGALLVKLFGQPAREVRAFEDKAGRVRDIGVRRAVYVRLFGSALVLVAGIATAIVYGWGGVLAATGSLAVGTLVALTAYLSRLYAPLTALSNVQVDVLTALVSFDRVFEVLDLEPMVAENPEAIDIPGGPATVTFENVSFSYPRAEEVSLASLESVAVLDQSPSQQVLFDVSFTAQAGELVALVGPSGAGKTTISALIPRLYDVRAGAVCINGVDVRDATFASLRERVGVVTQDAHLLHDTIRANLLFARPEATEPELVAALRAAQILPLVESLPDGLDTLVGDRGYRLSGGEKQRIAIARLLLKAPDIVVLDEATAHLDSESEAAMQRALATALEGRTSIVIAHRLSTVRDADQILVIEQGRIVQRGRHRELLATEGLYAELYRTQFEGQATVAAATAGV